MTQAHHASLALLRSLDLSLLASDLPVVAPGQAPPEWIKVTPAGKVNARDGRTFTFDPGALAARFNADKVDVPVDLDHSTVLKASRGETPTTVGYIPEMQGRDDGTYARVDWNKAGRDTLAAGTHRYVSPSMHLDAVNNATWLHSIALTSAPALSMPAIAAALGLDAGRAGGDGAVPQLAGVAGALGLAATADEAAILAAIGAMVPKATHETTLAALASTSDKLAALTTSTRKADVDRLVDGAIREKKIVPAQRDSYLAMCATEAGVETFRGLMAATMPMLQPSGLDGKTPPTSDRPATAAGIIEAAQMLMIEKAKLGVSLTMAQAINAVANRSPA